MERTCAWPVWRRAEAAHPPASRSKPSSARGARRGRCRRPERTPAAIERARRGVVQTRKQTTGSSLMRPRCLPEWLSRRHAALSSSHAAATAHAGARAPCARARFTQMPAPRVRGSPAHDRRASLAFRDTHPRSRQARRGLFRQESGSSTRRPRRARARPRAPRRARPGGRQARARRGRRERRARLPHAAVLGRDAPARAFGSAHTIQRRVKHD